LLLLLLLGLLADGRESSSAVEEEEAEARRTRRRAVVKAFGLVMVELSFLGYVVDFSSFFSGIFSASGRGPAQW
jgi:hypothetical protein